MAHVYFPAPGLPLVPSAQYTFDGTNFDPVYNAFNVAAGSQVLIANTTTNVISLVAGMAIFPLFACFSASVAVDFRLSDSVASVIYLRCNLLAATPFAVNFPPINPSLPLSSQGLALTASVNVTILFTIYWAQIPV